jgi:O-methyltransferase
MIMKMSKKLFRSIFAAFGYEVRKKTNARLELEEGAEEAINKISSYTMLSPQRLIALYQKVAFCEVHMVSGSFVECGVWKGGSVGLMALANMKYGKKRRHIHLFDSFQEICAPDYSVDGEKAILETKKWTQGCSNGKLVPLTGIYDVMGGPGTLEGNKDLLECNIGYDSGYLHYHKGWFQDTLPNDADKIGDIAILRLDGDWYASTKVCLEYLYDKVVSGGFIIIDDYWAYDGCKKAVDEFIQSRGIKAFLIDVDLVCVYWIKP